jgi:hypothetical protein
MGSSDHRAIGPWRGGVMGYGDVRRCTPDIGLPTLAPAIRHSVLLSSITPLLFINIARNSEHYPRDDRGAALYKSRKNSSKLLF